MLFWPPRALGAYALFLIYYFQSSLFAARYCDIFALNVHFCGADAKAVVLAKCKSLKSRSRSLAVYVASACCYRSCLRVILQ